MTPTPKLRFIERVEQISTHPDGSKVVRRVRILQQWWQNKWYPPIGEWRDVPLEAE